MDATVKQRILGVIVLVGLLGFCLTVLLRNTKTQPHIPKIDVHPAFVQTVPTEPQKVVTQNMAKTQNMASLPQPDSVFTKPATTAPATTPAASITTSKIQTIPQTIATPNNTVTQNKTETPTPNITKPQAIVTAPPKTQDIATNGGLQIDTQNIGAPNVETPTTTAVSAAVPEHHKHHHQIIAASHKKEASKTAGDKKNLMVQVGTFSVVANAETLVDKLHSKGFSAVAEKMKTSKGEMTRVIVGKKGLDHAQAETLRKDLEKSMKLNGIIVSHAKD